MGRKTERNGAGGLKITNGIDLVEVSRMAHSLQSPRFLLRVFSQAEQDLFAARGNRPETIAANFAAKEAFAKALGTGLSGFALREVSVLRNVRGAPYLELTGRAAQLGADAVWSVSLSHTNDLAIALVTALWREPINEEGLPCMR